MEEENVQAQEGVEEQEENTQEESNEEEQSDSDDSITLSKADYTAMRRKAIAYDANKTKKPEVKENITNEQKPASLSATEIEETVLRAQGVSGDELKMLKKVANINSTSLIEAQRDEFYLSWKDKKEKEEKSDKAKLGASKGSGTQAKKKDFSTPGLSDEDHKAMWKEKMQG